MINQSNTLRLPILLMAISLTVIGSVWAWLGQAQPTQAWPLANGEKLYCMSYTPFQPGQSPFDKSLIVSPDAIASDLKRIASLTECVRTYSAASNGIGAVADAAAEQGLSVLQGIWISPDPVANTAEIDAALRAAERHSTTIKALIVGNEVLLRREQTATGLIALIRRVKARTKLPVTYADVWEFWLKNPEIAREVDFITLHILPYWEDHPVAADRAAQHVLDITKTIQAAFPGKDIIIGEVGWPSAGRMREAALPSPVNQARVISDVIAAAKTNAIRVNLIEAFDQPWKRQLEGTVGGHWGLFDAYERAPKFTPGAAISGVKNAAWLAVVSSLLALMSFAASMFAGRLMKEGVSQLRWISAALNATIASLLFGLAIPSLADSAHGAAGVARSLALGSVALLAAFQSVVIVSGNSPASFATLLGGAAAVSSKLSRFSGLYLMFASVIAMTISLTLTFDPRYAELPFAPMTAAAVAAICLRFGAGNSHNGKQLNAETLFAGGLMLTALFVAIHEGVSNWQAQWLAAAVLALAAALIWPLQLAGRTQET
jgi:exo-beta-1,3-glucanase (GH17 family)